MSQIYKPKVLVTGGAGAIGSNLCKVLLEQDSDVYAVDNFVTGERKNIAALKKYSQFYFEELDITDANFLFKYSKQKFDQIFHLACQTGVPNIERLGEEMLKTCSIGIFNVMEIARLSNASVVYTSTAEIYGQPEVSPQHEAYNGNVNPIGPRAPYEEGKRFGETIVATYVRKYGLQAKIVRPFNSYGPGISLQDPRLIPQTIRRLLEGKELVVYGDGTQKRTLVYVDDMVSGLITVMNKGKAGEVYNVGGSEQITVKEVIERLLHLTNLTNVIVHKPHFIEDHKHRKPCVKKVSSLGWTPQVNLEQGLTNTLKYYNVPLIEAQASVATPSLAAATS